MCRAPLGTTVPVRMLRNLPVSLESRARAMSQEAPGPHAAHAEKAIFQMSQAWHSVTRANLADMGLPQANLNVIFAASGHLLLSLIAVAPAWPALRSPLKFLLLTGLRIHTLEHPSVNRV